MISLAEKLEILVITYNRDKLLSDTLKQFKGSIFSTCKLTIVDNCSTDETFQVYQNYLSDFQNLLYYKNKVNIGGNANIIRAAEISNSLYTWIICDDDKYDFSDCQDVIDKLIEGEVPLIHMGAHDLVEWRHGGHLETAKTLLSKDYNYFTFGSFLPCNLFRTELFYQNIRPAYDNIINMYPHMPMVINFFEGGEKMYVAKNRIVTAVIASQEYNQSNIILSWLRTCRLIKRKKYQQKAFFSSFFNMSYSQSFLLVLYLAFKNKQKFNYYREFLSFLSCRNLLIIFSTLPFTLLQLLNNKVLNKKV